MLRNTVYADVNTYPPALTVNKPDFSYNFFHIDDWFIRIGVIWLIVCLIVFASRSIPLEFTNPLLYVMFVAPVVILIIGYRVRQVEKRTLAVWRILYRHTSIKARDIIDNSDISRKQLHDSIRLLNNRGLGFYVWNKNNDTIVDGRLDDEYVMIDSCESCGAPVKLRVSLADSEIPKCSYCESPVASGQLNLLKQSAIAQLRGYQPAERRYGLPVRNDERPMSVLLFIFLLIFCWPLAVIYGIYKSRSRRRYR